MNEPTFGRSGRTLESDRRSHGQTVTDGLPLFSSRQHLSFDDCLEIRRKIIRTVLCCIVYDSCAQCYIINQLLNLHVGLGLLV